MGKLAVPGMPKDVAKSGITKKLPDVKINDKVKMGGRVKVTVGSIDAKYGVNAQIMQPEEVEAASQAESFMEKGFLSSVGATLTADGVDAWVQDVGGYPVPIRFDTETICHTSAIV